MIMTNVCSMPVNSALKLAPYTALWTSEFCAVIVLKIEAVIVRRESEINAESAILRRFGMFNFQIMRTGKRTYVRSQKVKVATELPMSDAESGHVFGKGLVHTYTERRWPDIVGSWGPSISRVGLDLDSTDPQQGCTGQR